jgi:hypothetical protein
MTKMASSKGIDRAIWRMVGRAMIYACAAVAALGFCASVAHAQGSRKDDIVFGATGHPISGATITVCAATANGTPCSPLATIYTDATLTVPSANPFQSDGIGNYHFYAPAGRYLLQFTGPQISGTITEPDVILPADVSSTGSGNNISAFGLTLGGNLTVAGNATITGTLSTTSFNPGNFAPSSLNVTGNEIIQGPRPHIDATAYGAGSITAVATTGSISNGTTTLTVASASGWAVGNGVAITSGANTYVGQITGCGTAAILAACTSTTWTVSPAANASYTNQTVNSDSTVPLTNAILAACSGGSGIQSISELYLSPGNYPITQQQGSSTAPDLPICKNFVLTGGMYTGSASLQFSSTPQVAITVSPGGSPTSSPIFQFSAAGGSQNAITLQNVVLAGYNQAVVVDAGQFHHFFNVCLGAANTSMADNVPLKMVNNFWLWWQYGCADAAIPTQADVLMVGQGSSGTEDVGLIFFSDLIMSGGGIHYDQRSNNGGANPGAMVFRNITRENAGTDFFTVTNSGGTYFLGVLAAIDIENFEDSDASDATAAVINFNAAGSSLSGVHIVNSTAGNAGAGVAIRMTAGGLRNAVILGIGSTAVVDANGNPIGGAIIQTAHGFDYVVNTTDANRLRTDNSASGANSVGPPLRAMASGSPFASVAVDPVAGYLFGDGASYGFEEAWNQTTKGSIDFQIANVLPPTNVAGTATTGGTLAAGTYYLAVRTGNCSTGSAYVSPPFINNTGVVVSGANNAINITWTPPAVTWAGYPYAYAYCVTVSTSPINMGTQNGFVVAGGLSTSSVLYTGQAQGFGTLSAASTMTSVHRFTSTSLGINTTSPQYNLDVNGSASAQSYNTIQMANKFAGSDAAAQIQACVTAAQSTSTVCDARGMTGALTGASHVVIPAGVTLLWDSAQLTINDSTNNDAVELTGDGASVIGTSESTSGFIACGVAGCTTVKNPNQATSKINYVHIGGMYLKATGASSKVIDLTSIGHSTIEHNNLLLGTGGTSYGIFGNTSTGEFDGTNSVIRHNNISPNSAGDTCLSLTGIYNAMVIEQNTCVLPGSSSTGFVLAKDTAGNYPDNDVIMGNDCESGSVVFGQLCYNIISALSVTLGPGNRCEDVYNCIQFPVDGSAVGIHVLDPYFSLTNNTQVKSNEPATAEVAIDNNGHNWTPSMHFGQNDLSGPNLLGNSGFEGWQNSTTLYYWGGASGTSINQAGSGIYAQQSSASAPADSFTQGSYNLKVGDGATAGLGVNSACIMVDPQREYTLMFRVASGSTSNNFRPGFRYFSDANCTSADVITDIATNARVLAPANAAGNLQSTNASLTYNNGMTCNCNVTGADWQVGTASTWTVNRNYGVVSRIPNAGGTGTAHSMIVFLLENTAAAGNYVYFDDVILSQGPVSPDIRPAALADSGNGGTVNAYSNYNFAGTVSLASNTANTGTFSHSITANRTWTLPDATGPVIVQSGSTPANNDCAQFSVSGSTVTIKDSGAGCAAAGALASWGLQHAGSGQAFSSNAVKVWGIIIPYGVSYSHIDYDVGTLDSSTSDNYDLGLYGPCAVNTSSCALVTHIGAQNMTSTGYKQASVTSGTLSPGLYWIAMTGNATTAQLATTSVSEWTACPSTNSSTTSSGGALPSTIATPNCSAPQWTGAAVVSIGFE